MYLKKHTVLQKLFSEKYHWGGGTSSQGAPNSLWQKHKLTAWWRRNLMQLWEAYAWETVAPHIPQCCRDFFFPRKCHLKHIYNWTQQRLWNWTGTAHLFEFFGKHFAGFFVFLWFFLFLFLFLSHFALTFISPCNFNALDEECIISHTSFFLKKRLPSA